MASPFSIVHRVQFSETDLAGVVHFSNYFRMMEEVEQAFFRSLGLSVVMAHGGQSLGFPRIAARCEYLSPAHFDQEIELRLSVVKVGRSSFTYEVDFLLGQTHIAKGEITTVCCAMTDHKFRAIEIPEEIRQRLQSHVPPTATAGKA